MDTQHLSKHYLSCIEAEDRRSLQLRKQDIGRRFVIAGTNEEIFLNEGLDMWTHVPSTKRDLNFFSKAFLDNTGTDKGFYGYPLYFDKQGKLSPLFIQPIAVENLGGKANEQKYRFLRTERLLVNRYLFSGYADEELDVLVNHLESDEFANFAARINAAMDYLKHPAFDATIRKIESFPTGAEKRWVRTPIFLRDARGPFTYNLRKDLSALSRYKSVANAASGSALEKLLEPQKNSSKNNTAVGLAQLLPLNRSQERAALEGLGQPLTVITGPPGTGKSQVVVDLLASSILTGKTVLFASKNNQAVHVVQQRLREALGEPLDFSLRIGSRNKMRELAPDLQDRLARLVKTGAPKGEAAARKSIEQCQKELDRLDRLSQKYKAAKRAEALAKKKLDSAWVKHTPNSESPFIDLDLLRFVQDESKAYAGLAPLGLIRWVKRLFQGSTIRRQMANQLLTSVVDLPANHRRAIANYIQKQAGYEPIIKISEILFAYHDWLEHRNRLFDAGRELKEVLHRTGSVKREYRAIKVERAKATRLFCRATWGKKILERADDIGTALDDYQNALDSEGGTGYDYIESIDRIMGALRRLMDPLCIWITTALSVRNAVPLRSEVFDLLIIDEASQCDIASAVPLLYRAKQVVIIGDPKQLRHIPGIPVDVEESLAFDDGILPLWSYTKQSLFDVATRAFTQLGYKAPFFLEEHYRSHETIINFSNSQFYGGRLDVQTDMEAMRRRLPDLTPGVFWLDVKGEVPGANRSAYNLQEIDAIEAFVQELLTAYSEVINIGIVTPFRAQADRLKERIIGSKWFDNKMDLRVGTAHTFQGDECDIIVFSPVVAMGMKKGTRDWVAKTESLLNVAVTRARAVLYIVGDRMACESAGGPLSALSRHAISFHNNGIEHGFVL